MNHRLQRKLRRCMRWGRITSPPSPLRSPPQCWSRLALQRQLCWMAVMRWGCACWRPTMHRFRFNVQSDCCSVQSRPHMGAPCTSTAHDHDLSLHTSCLADHHEDRAQLHCSVDLVQVSATQPDNQAAQILDALHRRRQGGRCLTPPSWTGRPLEQEAAAAAGPAPPCSSAHRCASCASGNSASLCCRDAVLS
jgi:hypothetical protein